MVVRVFGAEGVVKGHRKGVGGQESGGGEWSGVEGGRVMEDGEWRMMSLSREMAR